MTTDRIILAGALCDATGMRSAPGAVRVRGATILEAGPVERVVRPGEEVEEHPGLVVMPALVNAHAHLDLTHIGPCPYHGAFRQWIDMVRTARHTEPEAIAASVRLGAGLCRAGGTGLVGDIAGAGRFEAAEALGATGLGGVSYLEFFGIGKAEGPGRAALSAALARPKTTGSVRVGLQPHAPYSVSRALYVEAARAAAAQGRPISTHLAETREELLLLHSGKGALAEFLKDMGVWSESLNGGTGLHPIEAIEEALRIAPFGAAHVNFLVDVDEGEEVRRRRTTVLAEASTSVIYCPRASAYFGHRDHPYRELAAGGVNVALGTDSIVCLDRDDRISVLDEARLLYRRDGAEAAMLLAMATVNGCRALGLPSGLATLEPGPVAGLIGVSYDPAFPGDPWEAVLAAKDDPVIVTLVAGTGL